MVYSNCQQDDSQDDSQEMGSAYVVVYSVTDCSSFDTASRHQRCCRSMLTVLFEGAVRQIRLRQDGKKASNHQHSLCKDKEGITQKARHFLDRLVVCNHQCMPLKACSKS